MAAYRRRLNKGKLKSRLILMFLLLLLVFNLDHVAQFLIRQGSERLQNTAINDIIRMFYPYPHRGTVEIYAREYGVDPYLVVAVMKAESNFNQRAISEKGALGLMQIMPETGQWAAKQTGGPVFSPEQLFDPETNIKLGTWYISNLAKEFYGNPVLMLAAYNAGRGNVQGWLASGTVGYAQVSLKEIPFPETRNFVQNVLTYYNIYSRLYRS